MASMKEGFVKIPEGSGVLFFIQIFSTLGFAVLYSSLVLYTTQQLNFPTKEATNFMGVFGAFNYGLHMFGGYLGGRFLSNRNLFVGGMVLQVIGCLIISLGSAAMLYWGLAFFLTGCGLNVTCINMMLTQRFKPDDARREGAFLWNYAGMNIGFFIGFAVAGHYQLTKNYPSLFVFATVGNIVAIILCFLFWRTLADRDTPLLEVKASQFRNRFLGGVSILVVLIPLLWILLRHSGPTNLIIKLISAGIVFGLIWLTARHRDFREKKNMWAYLILTLGSLVFWTLYMMAPNGLQIFAVSNVNRQIGWGIEVAPAWIQNINSVVIVVGGPLMAVLFNKLRDRGWKIDIPKQFSASLFCMGLGFLILPLGIYFADKATGMVAFSWIFWSYVLQSVGELLISPIGYAMIGKLAPRQYQGVMMGTFMLVSGIASLFAGDFSGMVPDPGTGSAIVTNPVYSSLFAKLGWGTLIVGVLLALLVPFLNKLISDKEENTESDENREACLS